MLMYIFWNYLVGSIDGHLVEDFEVNLFNAIGWVYNTGWERRQRFCQNYHPHTLYPKSFKNPNPSDVLEIS